MKKYLLSATLALFLIFGTQSLKAQDGFFSNAKTLEKGTFAVGLQPVVLSEQNDFMMIVRGSYGLSHGVTGHLKVGGLDDDFYGGAHLEYNIAAEPDSPLSVAVLAGAYSYDYPGLKFGLNISRDFHPISIYTGINYQPLFVDDTTINSFLLPVGLDYHIQNAPVDLMLEADVPLEDAQYLEAITFGARFYLN